jgi:hypothetical protein
MPERDYLMQISAAMVLRRAAIVHDGCEGAIVDDGCKGVMVDDGCKSAMM